MIHVMSDGITSEASQKIQVVPGILGHIFFLSHETALNGAVLASRGPILWVIFVFFWNIV
jgi:hypothetical protein